MRLFVVCFLALSGWAAAAPGATSSSSKDSSEGVQQQKVESENDTLAPAISDIARRKRGSAPTNLPYSNYRPNSGMHRYRYPLYRKRSYRPQPSYDYEDEVILPEVENDYLDYEEQRGPSLFRERNLQQQQERKKKDMLYEDDGYFSDDYIPERQLLSNPYIIPLKKKDSAYNLAGIDPYDLEELNQIHSVGRKSPPRMSPTEQFYDAIDSIRKKKAMFDDSMSPSDATDRMEHLLQLKEALSSAAANRYLHGQSDPMIRRKRDVTAAHPNVVANSNATVAHKDLASTVPARYKQAQSYGDRRKRAFNDYYKWERNALASDYQPMEKRSSGSDRDYDYLTREYFKSIARSVGQKKKRMAYAQFEADKRSSGLDEFLENPSMLEYMQSKLREAEQEVAEEAEKELSEGDTEELLSNIVVRLDALERMREALSRLEELQNEETVKPQRVGASDLSAAAKKRLSSSSGSSVKAASRKRSDVGRMKMSAVNARRMRRMRRGEDILNSIFLDNTREDCPVLDRILMNCIAVSEIAGDQDQAFREPCIRHEVCYMCGSGLSVSGHECDAVLSSSLEATCSGNLDCLSAAGDTFNLLSNADRYDDEGTCTHDPCVRKFLESR